MIEKSENLPGGVSSLLLVWVSAWTAAYIRLVDREIWRDVLGLEGSYRVSSLGRVLSVGRKIDTFSRRGLPCVRYTEDRILRPGRMYRGHLSVMLGRVVGSKCVHALVAEAFLPSRPPGYEVRHRDGNPANNKLSNLVWGTRSDNMRDVKWHTGRINYKLTPQDVLNIKRAFRNGIKGVDLARNYGMSQSNMSSIKHNRIHIDVT